MSSQDECKPYSEPTAEEANSSQRQPFPSNPAFYFADPSSDVLEIKALDFAIDPPEVPVVPGYVQPHSVTAAKLWLSIDYKALTDYERFLVACIWISRVK
jgi:hypothetical protein